MRRSLIPAILAATWCGLLYAAPVQAQATRTWVSGVGDDANPCSRTAPCKTWAGAISKTAAGGEMDALDPGGFGALTITKSITIDGGGGQVASVLVAGTQGITVAAASNDRVIIRNMRLDGLLGNGSNPGNAGINGINFISGQALIVEHCEIFGFNQNGIFLNTSAGTSTLKVSDCNIDIGNAVGVEVRPTGSAGAQVSIQRTSVSNVGTGFRLDGNFTTGQIQMDVTDSAAVNSSDTGFKCRAGTSPRAIMMLNHDIATGNANFGLQSDGGTCSIIFGSSIITANGTGVNATNGAAMSSYGNNQIDGNNSANGSPTSTFPLH